MERTIAVIGGTGNQGFGLALRWAKAGERVVIGSRQESKAKDAAKRVREMIGSSANVEGSENSEAVSQAKVIVLTVPFTAQIDIIKSVLANLKQNDVFIDVTVPIASAVGGRASRTLGIWQGSAAEQAGELLPSTVHLAAAFHNVVAEALQQVEKSVDCDVLVCGNSPVAKNTVFDLVSKIPGLRAVDGGPLENARMAEQITALLIGLNMRYKVSGAGVRFTGLPIG